MYLSKKGILVGSFFFLADANYNFTVRLKGILRLPRFMLLISDRPPIEGYILNRLINKLPDF